MNAIVPEDCLFYQSMELPGIGLIEGSWDHRRTANDYLGHVDFRGKRALDVGPANGFFSFEMERRGAEVTALDLGPEADWDAVPHPYLEPAAVQATLRDNVRRVENAFRFAHRMLGSKVKLLHGSVYDTPALVPPVSIALMGNVLQHLRDPFRAIERVAQAVTDTLIITEAVWDTDETFLVTPRMRLIPSADTPNCNHSWWQVSPALVVQILRLLGFPRLSFQYHQQTFVASATDARARWVKHFTVTGTRPSRLTEEDLDGSALRIIFPADAWHAEEHGAVHRWRWSSDRRATISIENLDARVRVVSIACGLASLRRDRIELRLNGSIVWSGEVVGLPTPVFTMAAPLHPGANTLEFRAGIEASRAPGDPRALGLAVYDVAISPDRRVGEVPSVTDDEAVRPASTPTPLGDPARGRGYAEPAHVTDLGELTALLREPDADRARLREDVDRLTVLLRDSDADRAARLDQVRDLTRLLQESEADRAARFEVIQNLQAKLASLQARSERMERTYVWRCYSWLHSRTTGRNPGE